MNSVCYTVSMEKLVCDVYPMEPSCLDALWVRCRVLEGVCLSNIFLENIWTYYPCRTNYHLQESNYKRTAQTGQAKNNCVNQPVFSLLVARNCWQTATDLQCMFAVAMERYVITEIIHNWIHCRTLPGDQLCVYCWEKFTKGLTEFGMKIPFIGGLETVIVFSLINCSSSLKSWKFVQILSLCRKDSHMIVMASLCGVILAFVGHTDLHIIWNVPLTPIWWNPATYFHAQHCSSWKSVHGQ